jgi:hypothetical protein
VGAVLSLAAGKFLTSLIRWNMTPIFETPADFIERYDNCVDDMGVAFAFEPDDAVDFHLHQFCEGVANRMLDHFPKFPKDEAVTFVAELAQLIRQRKKQIEAGRNLPTRH